MERLLLLYYPSDAPVLDVLGGVRALLDDAGIKYSVERAEKTAQETLILPKLSIQSPSECLRVATVFRKKPKWPPWLLSLPHYSNKTRLEKDLDCITSTQLYRLMQYHKQRARAAGSLRLTSHGLRDRISAGSIAAVVTLAVYI